MAKKAWKDLEGQFFRIDVGSTQAEALASEESNVLYITTEQSVVMNGDVVGTIDKKNENGDIRLMVYNDVSGSILINGEEKAVDGYGVYTFKDVGSFQPKTASVNRGVSGLDLSKWHPVNITSLYTSFAAMNVRELDLSHLDVSNVTDMKYTFVSLKSDKLDVSTWDTSKVTDFNNIFNGIKLEELNLMSFSLKSAITNDRTLYFIINAHNLKKIWLGPNFFNNPKLKYIRIDAELWTDATSIKESLYTNLFDRRKLGSYYRLTLYLNDNTASVLTSEQRQRLTDYGYYLPKMGG